MNARGMTRRSALVAITLVSFGAHAQQASPTQLVSRVENGLLPRIVSERTRPMRSSDCMRQFGVPGVSVAVVDKGQIVWAHAWGVAQAGQAQPLTPETLMQAGSISKAVAAVGALRMVDQGLLNLDVDVNTQLRSWRVPPGAQSADKPVTLRRLLSHSAGLSVHGFPGYGPGAPLPALPQILDGVPPANTEAVCVTKAPGSEWRYSGGGYVLMQQLMEDVNGQPFADWMQREVLAPAGMSKSLYGALPTAPLARAAVGHENGRAIEGLRATYPELAAAGLWTTPTDLARLSIALQRILSGTAAEPSSLLTSQRLAEALTVQAKPLGLGFFLEGSGVQQYFGHDGSNAGFEALWKADRQQRAVIVMANANGANGLIEELVRAVAQEQGWTEWQAKRVTARQMRGSFLAKPLFLRGSMNNWGLAAALRPVSRRRFASEVDLPAGATEFKFASEDWQTVDLGAGEAPRAALTIAGPNLRIDAKAAGRYRFELDVRDPLAPRYTVRPTKAAR